MSWKSHIAWPELPVRTQDSKIRLKWATDMHISASTANSQYLALRDLVASANIDRPQALLVSGDLSTDTIGSLRNAFSLIRACHIPVIDVIGNHDEEELVGGTGHPNTAEIEKADCFDQNAPFYHARTLAAGDNSWSALCLSLDCNFYADDPANILDVPNHANGDRIGHVSGLPPGGSYRMFTSAQINWVESQLNASDADAVFVMVHYPPFYHTDYALLVDKFQADGRPTIAFCGHNHPNALIATQQSSDTLYTLNLYKAPAMLESGCWVDATLSFTDDLAIDSMVIRNYTPQSGWTIAPPFSLP